MSKSTLTIKQSVDDIWENEYQKITKQYHQDINDLDSSRRSFEGVCESNSLELGDVVFLPEFEQQIVTVPLAISRIVPLNEEEIEVLFWTGDSFVVEVSGGKILRENSLYRALHPRSIFEGKRVMFERETAGENEYETRVTEKYSPNVFLHRHTDRTIKVYYEGDHFRNDNRVYRKEFLGSFGTSVVACFHDVETGKKETLLINGGRHTPLRYRGEWYQYNQKKGTMFHCKSRTYVPCVFGKEKILYVQNDVIFSIDAFESNDLSIMRPLS